MRIFLLFILGLFGQQVSAQDLLEFEVSSGNTDRTDCPVSLSIDQLNYNTDDYTLRYRLVIFDGKMTPEEAETYWQAFANPPAINILR